MAYAMMYPKGNQGKRSDLLQNCKKSDDDKIDASAISRARFILKNDREKAELVRDATPGQKAMATAMAFPENAKGGDRKSKDFKSFDPDEFGFSGKTIQRARYVLRNNPIPEGQQYPQRCLDIMAGSLTLTVAYRDSAHKKAHRRNHSGLICLVRRMMYRKV